MFLMLYKELYFRHLYAKLGSNITIEQRIESWDNYTTLFERIFSDDDDDNLLGEASIFMARGLGLAECRSPPASDSCGLLARGARFIHIRMRSFLLVLV